MDVDDAVGIDAQEVAVVGQVVDRAQGQAVDHGRAAERITVLDGVRRLEERGLLSEQTVHRA
ncbi:MAG: hypothetical protein MSC31_07400 [Solirubrobacteraceae bacterium MAG38_C4-C5]|nr:hypothetical protein [Candidatus Siliceabacter maunaloa]